MLTPGLYLVTPDQADGDALFAAVAALLPARPALVQYRNKLADAAARRDQATRLLALCRGAGVPLIINDDLALALAIGADGVHLGRDDGDPAEARRALGPGRILGVSCYDEWARAKAGAAAGVDVALPHGQRRGDVALDGLVGVLGFKAAHAMLTGSCPAGSARSAGPAKWSRRGSRRAPSRRPPRPAWRGNRGR